MEDASPILRATDDNIEICADKEACDDVIMTAEDVEGALIDDVIFCGWVSRAT